VTDAQTLTPEIVKQIQKDIRRAEVIMVTVHGQHDTACVPITKGSARHLLIASHTNGYAYEMDQRIMWIDQSRPAS